MTSPTALLECAPLIHLVEDDVAQAEQLSQALLNSGYRVQVFANPAEFRAAHARTEDAPPAAVIMGIIFPEDDDAGVTFAAELGLAKETGIPVVATSARDDLPARLAAFRAGACRYLLKPVETTGLIDLLDSLTGRLPAQAYRVLLVDDDPLQLEAQGAVLRAAGMEVRTLSQPLRTMEVVDEFDPDVMVLDMYMPGVTGPELAALLRQRHAHLQLPILFLSVETDIAQQLEAVNLGGDNFMVKPVQPDHLVAAVTARAERVRQNTTIRKRLENTLYEREREHLALDQHAIVSIADRAGNISYVNNKFCEISGYSRGELLGQNHRIVKSGEHPPEFYQNLWRTIASGEVWQGNIANRRKDGSLYWVESTITPFLDGNGEPYQYVSIRTDITHVKAAEVALRASQSRLNFLLSSSPATIYTCGLTPPYGATYISPNVKQLMGFEPEQFTENGQFWLDNIHPDDRQRVLDELPQIFERGVHHDEYRFRMNDGSYRWMYDELRLVNDDGGQPVEIAGYWMDITERKRAEQAADVHKERLRRGQLFANIGTWDWNIRTSELFWTERIAPLFGYAEGELETSYENFLAAVHPDDRQAVIDAVNACVEHDTPYEIEHRVVWPDGTERWLLERGAVARDAAGTPLHMLGVVQDIDDRKRAELALAQRERQLREAQSLAHMGNWQANLITGELTWSDEIYRIFGHEPGSFEPSVEAFLAAVHPDDRLLVQESEKRAEQTGRHDVVHRIVRPDGTVRHVHELAQMETDATETRVRLTGTVQDITERKHAEQALKENQAKLSGLFALSPLGIALTDLNGRYLEFNEAFQAICGYPAEELKKLDYWTLTPPEYEAQEAMQLESLRRTGRYGPYEKTYRQKNGDLIPIRLNGILVKDQTGQSKIWSIVEDITDSKRAEQALIAARDEADRASQAKSEFLSSMSHELRTPMNAILGFGQLMEFDDTLPDEHQDNVREILKAGHHLLELINEVLDLAKVESGHIDLSLEPVEVCPIVEECLSLVGTLAARRHIRISHRGLKGAAVRADRTRLKQALLNLLSNAIKYNHDGGSVALDVRPAAAGRLRIQVADTGGGIAAARLSELFQPFNRLGAEHGKIEGTGIGLTITRRIVEMMGGTVGVESEVGSGSTFWIDLPVETATPSPHRREYESTGAENDTSAQSGTPPHTVLYIEDNPSNIKLVAQILGRRRHIHLLTAHTPELGIELALMRRPELILLDINMPGMDGYHVLEVFKAEERLRAIPVVAVTANAMPRDIERGRAAGFSDYLTKPIDVAKFLDILERCLPSCGETEV